MKIKDSNQHVRSDQCSYFKLFQWTVLKYFHSPQLKLNRNAEPVYALFLNYEVSEKKYVESLVKNLYYYSRIYQEDKDENTDDQENGGMVGLQKHYADGVTDGKCVVNSSEMKEHQENGATVQDLIKVQHFGVVQKSESRVIIISVRNKIICLGSRVILIKKPKEKTITVKTVQNKFICQDY